MMSYLVIAFIVMIMSRATFTIPQPALVSGLVVHSRALPSVTWRQCGQCGPCSVITCDVWTMEKLSSGLCPDHRTDTHDTDR